MSFNVLRKVGVAGGGAMGTGIVQVSAQAGYEVYLYDVKEGAADKSKANIATVLNRLVERGRITEKAAKSTLDNIHIAKDVKEIAQCDLVIEAIIERLDIKQNFFKEIEALGEGKAILASNTSSLTISEIASKLDNPSRMIGLHFFNPVPLMKLAEIIPGLKTDPALIKILEDYVKAIGHTAVIADDSPGFLVNHAGRAYGTEALKILGEGVASIEQIDTVLREGVKFRLGPFELLDLLGLDVSHPVMESIYNQYYQEPRYRPHSLAQTRVVAGVLGRKTGVGFYEYDDKLQKISTPKSEKFPMWQGDAPIVWIGSEFEEDRAQLTELLNKYSIKIDLGETPAAGSIILLATWGYDATSAVAHFNVDPVKTVCIDLLTDLENFVTLMVNPKTSEETISQFQFVFKDVEFEVIRDSVGFIAQRVVASIINLACDIAQQQVATVEDIDLAVQLGLAYPYGPLVWGDQIGGDKVKLILDRIYQLTTDPRYRVSPWLRRRADLGLSLKHVEQVTF